MAQQITGSERLYVSSGGSGSDIQIADLVTYAKSKNTGATVANGAAVAVCNSSGADSHNATAVVTGTPGTPGTLTGINLAQATTALVDAVDSVPLVNSAGATVGSASAALVPAGLLTGVQLVATNAVVAQADAINVINSAGTITIPSTADVALGVVTDIRMRTTSTALSQDNTVQVTNSALAAVAGSHRANVAAGVLTQVALASTVAPLVSDVKVVVPVSGSVATGFTPTIVDGVITSILLS